MEDSVAMLSQIPEREKKQDKWSPGIDSEKKKKRLNFGGIFQFYFLKFTYGNM